MIQVNFDEGQTWPSSHHLLLDEGPGTGYPSLTQIDAEHVESTKAVSRILRSSDLR